MLNRLSAATAALAAMVALGSPAQALDLTGQSVNGTYGSFFRTISVQNLQNFASPAVVGPGIEFTAVERYGPTQALTVMVDVTATGFDVIMQVGSVYNLPPGFDFATIELTGLSGISPVRFTGWACQSTTVFCNQPDFGPAATINYVTALPTGARVGFNTYIDATYSFSFEPQSNAVPEPASWAMLIAGFGLVGALQRRRRPQAA